MNSVSWVFLSKFYGETFKEAERYSTIGVAVVGEVSAIEGFGDVPLTNTRIFVEPSDDWVGVVAEVGSGRFIYSGNRVDLVGANISKAKSNQVIVGAILEVAFLCHRDCEPVVVNKGSVFLWKYCVTYKILLEEQSRVLRQLIHHVVCHFLQCPKLHLRQGYSGVKIREVSCKDHRVVPKAVDKPRGGLPIV
eukprot:CAMPEP_0202962414 /NCGR_PEP_ID=MMETSP1396-20130829/6519_1 /ASSEMBLY_ACC=CAM_ASM_000872 /TAXON_ID= /ORGANISM="Pseudokeronopsis sp., Strain Brazil" /LENGTH=191 /DNA_ID=CAMNT_0049682977 /DNA_START=754 /DNA_END=1328 /DNA_ORIENTATION=-